MTKRKTESYVWDGRRLTGSIDKFFDDVKGPTISTEAERIAALSYLERTGNTDVREVLGL